MAIGAPADSVRGRDAAGAVNVLYGGPAGLSAAGDQQFTQATPGIGGAPEQGDRFGEALTAGDLNGDGTGDLAIGVPGEAVGNRAAAGMVQVLYGSRDGFGTAVAIGDFDGDGDGDGEDDLGIGSPGEGVSGQDAAGAVNVLYASRGGLTARDQLWTQNTSGIKGLAGAGFQMGSALAAADTSLNGRDELASGSRAPGSPAGPTPARSSSCTGARAA